MTLASLCKASKNGHIDIVRYLIDQGANMISPNGDTALTSALKTGHLDIAKLLIGEGVDVNKHGRLRFTPLMLAAMNGNLDIAKILVENGAEVDMEVDSNNSDTAIVFAAKKGYLDIVWYLMDNHAKVDRIFAYYSLSIRLNLHGIRSLQQKEEDDCRTWNRIDGASPLFASGTIHVLRKR